MRIHLFFLVLPTLAACSTPDRTDRLRIEEVSVTNADSVFSKSKATHSDPKLVLSKDHVHQESNKVPNSTNSIPFPLRWERFGLDAGDTVTYSFCFASNPAFSVRPDHTSIEVKIGNELHETFPVARHRYFQNKLRLYLKPNIENLDSCTIELVDPFRNIAKLQFHQEREMSYLFLPQSQLKNKRRIVEECPKEPI